MAGAADTTLNPFAARDESRSVTLTFRMTPSEHEALKKLARARGGTGEDRGELVKLIREGLGLLYDRESKRKR